MNIKDFLYANRLKQVELANYLGVTEASISRMCKGISNPSKENLNKIIKNPYNWDTSMLVDSEHIVQTIGDGSSNNMQVAGGNDVAVLQERVKYLEKLLDEKERLITILIEKK